MFEIAIDFYNLLYSAALVGLYAIVFWQARLLTPPTPSPSEISSLVGISTAAQGSVWGKRPYIGPHSVPPLTWYGRDLVITAALLTTFRLYEIFGVTCFLHTRRLYTTGEPVRALVNTIWHYAGTAFAFATLYLIAYVLVDERFTTTSFTDSFLAPLYFSFVTLTTLGFGDLTRDG